MILARLRAARPPEPGHIVVPHGTGSFTVALKRSSTARRYTLRVCSGSGAIVMTLPAKADLRTASDFAARHTGWIAARLARLPEMIAMEPGATVPFRGVPHRIEHRPGMRGAVRVETGADGAPVIAVSGLPEHARRRVSDFLKREAGKDLAAAVSRHAAALGVVVSGITLRDTRSRWGSCTSAGRLNFSWRLIMAPPFVLDYLAAHEATHRREMNHSNRFWRLLKEICPATDEAEAWLDRNGPGLHRYR